MEKSKKTYFKKSLIIVCAFACLAAIQPLQASGEDATLPDLKVVDYVDLNKYMGTWYLIAELPSFFERQCASGQTANYTLNNDGTVTVLNSCFTKNDAKYAREGRAFIVDQETNAKLQVSFVKFFGIWPFRGDYWIVELGENYEYAVVGHPDRTYGWILSRSCTIADDVLDGIFSRLEEQAYNRNDFITIDQSKNDCDTE